MLEKDVKIINKLGLHLRAATKLVQLASDFEADITIVCNEQDADAKSIMDVLMLAAIVGTEINIKISGDNRDLESEIMDQIVNLIQDRFGEDE